MNSVSPSRSSELLPAGPRLLVVGADSADSRYAGVLGLAGFLLTRVASAGAAVRSALAEPPDAIFALLDASTAVSFCEVLRALGPQPLVVAGYGLSNKAAIDCLDLGADAAICLPLSAEELLSRVRAVWSRSDGRSGARSNRSIVLGGLTLDLDARAVFQSGRPVDLSPTEFELLAALAQRPGQVVTNRELLTRIWGEECADEVHYVRLYIGYLRNKLEEDPRRPQMILTQWGVGYRLATEPPDQMLAEVPTA